MGIFDIADAEFMKRKKEMHDFLQGIDYEALQKRVEDSFASPGCLDDMHSELCSLEARVAEFRKKDNISLPLADEQISKQARRLDAVVRRFKEKAQNDYDRAVREFPKEFAGAEKQGDGDLLQSCIRWLGGLSKRYKAARKVCKLPEHKEIEKYFQFSLETESIDREVEKLISRYRKAKTKADIERTREAARKLQSDYKAVRKKRRTLFGLHPAFRYESRELNALEKELNMDLFSAKAEMDGDISAMREKTERVKNGGMPRRRPEFYREKHDGYAGTVFLSKLVVQYISAFDELKKVSEDNYDVARKCAEIEEMVKEKDTDRLRRVDSNAFSHLASYEHCQNHFGRYNALCAQVSELVSAYDREQEAVAQRRKERIRRMELERAEINRRAEREKREKKEPQPQVNTEPANPAQNDSYCNLLLYVGSMGSPEDQGLAEISSTIKEFSTPWEKRLARVKRVADKSCSLDDENDFDYLARLRQGVKDSIENGTLTREMQRSEELRKAAQSALEALGNYIIRCTTPA